VSSLVEILNEHKNTTEIPISNSKILRTVPTTLDKGAQQHNNTNH